MPQCRQCLGPVPRLGQVTAAVALSIAPLPFNCSKLQTIVGPQIRDSLYSPAQMDPRGQRMRLSRAMISYRRPPLSGTPCFTYNSGLWVVTSELEGLRTQSPGKGTRKQGVSELQNCTWAIACETHGFPLPALVDQNSRVLGYQVHESRDLVFLILCCNPASAWYLVSKCSLYISYLDP